MKNYNNITFNKRKSGLLKKAAELSMLCNIQVCLAFTDVYGNLINFYSPDASVAQEFSKTHPYKKVYTFTKEDILIYMLQQNSEIQINDRKQYFLAMENKIFIEYILYYQQYPNFFGMRNKKKYSDVKKEDGDESNMDQIDESENGEEDDDDQSVQNSKISDNVSVSKRSHQKNEILSANNLAMKAKPQPKKFLKIQVPENSIIKQSMNVLKMRNLLDGGPQQTNAAPNQATNITSDSNKNNIQANQYNQGQNSNLPIIQNVQNIIGGNIVQPNMNQPKMQQNIDNSNNQGHQGMGNIINQQLLAQNQNQGLKFQEDLKQLQQFIVSGGGNNPMMNPNLMKNMQNELNNIQQNPFELLNTFQQQDPTQVIGNAGNFLNNPIYNNHANFMNITSQASPQFAQNNNILQNQQFDMYKAQQNQQQQNPQNISNQQQQPQQQNQQAQIPNQQLQQQQLQQQQLQQQQKKSFKPSSKSGLNSNSNALFQTSNNQGFLEQLLIHQQYQQPMLSQTGNSNNFLVPKSGNFQNPTSNTSLFNFINGKISESPNLDKLKSTLQYNTSNPFFSGGLFSGNNRFKQAYLELNSIQDKYPSLNRDDSFNLVNQQYQQYQMSQFSKQGGQSIEQDIGNNGPDTQQNYQGGMNQVLLQNPNQQQQQHNLNIQGQQVGNQTNQSQNQMLINAGGNNSSNIINPQQIQGMNNQQLNQQFFQQHQIQQLMAKHQDDNKNTMINGGNTKYINHEGGDTTNKLPINSTHNNMLKGNQNDSKMQ